MHRIFTSKQNNYEKQVRVLLKKNCIVHDVLAGFSLLIQEFQTWNFNAKKNFLITFVNGSKLCAKTFQNFPNMLLYIQAIKIYLGIFRIISN